jgi:hypothetical protein
MATKLRKSPPVCLWITSYRVIIGKLRLSEQFMGRKIKMQDGQVFTIFRHITRYPVPQSSTPTVFMVSFKFASLSHNANKIASILPMLLITGFPGFVTKMYGVNESNGYWQGMYQWQSKQVLEAYQKSFVFRMMNKRALNGTLSFLEIENQTLVDYIQDNLI